MRRLITILLLATGGMLSVAGWAWAETSCGRPAMSIMLPKVDNFLQRPETILDIFPNGDRDGGRYMEGTVRDLVATDIENVYPPMLKLLPRANLFQKKAIGAGLADTAKLCEKSSRPQSARRLLTAIRLASDQDALSAFMVAFADSGSVIDGFNDDSESTNRPLGKVTSPGTDVFSLRKLRDPFTTNDPFAPIR